ncbi:tRNA (adenosine(37)-N6)-threonylcarbamoyltransferase complex dimerization subunit type 1 TsaB [Undibacterium sp. TJN19]|uniref:tRNA (adenosine(37)-N6)-threonylcarbamoyltransferase complex dimerization subunit type 1 TsaB n=1 Tax=Undibacterium sp. TJN19 TaxID=3413055 RepID=UPI003BF0AC15
MTRILAIETSTELASAAVLADGQIFTRELSGVQTHSQGILPTIQSLLAEAGIALADCDAIAFGCGPGAFTGIRTACGIVQGLAYGAGLPVLPVVSLQAMAQAALEQTAEGEFVCILDARMSEVYWAQYRFTDAHWETVSEPALASMDEVFASLSGVMMLRDLRFVLGNGLALPEALVGNVTSIHCMPHAKQVATLGRTAFDAGNGQAAELAQPLYLRNKIALTTAERAQVKASG